MKKNINLIMILLLLCSIVFSTSCSESTIKNNVIYDIGYEGREGVFYKKDDSKINENLESLDHFVDVNISISEKQIPLTITEEADEVFYLEPIFTEGLWDSITLIGNEKGLYNLKKTNVKDKTVTLIKSGVHFINTVKWNHEKDKVAFNASGQLIIYDNSKDKLVSLDDSLNERDNISYFGWSSDDKKIYTENENLVNGSIYYVNSGKKKESYNEEDYVYLKNNLSEKYYFASLFEPVGKEINNTSLETRTVIVNENSEVVQELVEENFAKENSLNELRFRDSYKKSLIQLGNDGFGLYYTSDVLEHNKINVVSSEYIHMAKFMQGGGFAFTQSKNNGEENKFSLYIADSYGKILREVSVGNGNFIISPNGKYAYFDFPNREIVDLSNGEIISSDAGENIYNDNKKDEENIIKVLRQALYISINYLKGSDFNQSEVDKLFVDSENPYQWAKYDFVSYWKKHNETNENFKYEVNADIDDIYYFILNEKNMANVSGKIKIKSSLGRTIYLKGSITLLENEDQWKITGFSTFPNSIEKEKVTESIETYINKKSFFKDSDWLLGDIKGKDITIGQIQFWSLNNALLSEDVEYANFAKIYLNVSEDVNKEIYELSAEKQGSDWVVIGLEKISE
ncbi:hypothetical protein [Clostridium grantii]|uniref:Lipoprotein n=1 Tax=Clostridium grantii DSM 8605 TaxID=1121316 RepID=A0A1M5RJD9_9CLOT|nr:hypothetical protein [Clostridium grantii]SHH26395.1 hypothetical protein SAMN02745207_00567 [Clostridium grantii DSM 8605]